MNIGTTAGVVGMYAMLIVGIFEQGGNLGMFYDPAAYFVVILGSTFCIMAGYPMEFFLRIPTYLKLVFTKHHFDYIGLIRNLVTLSEIARREGLLSLEDRISGMDDEFMRKGLQMAVDGVDETIVKRTLHNDIAQMAIRHKGGYLMFETWAILSPSFGMLATLEGLIMMLGNLSDMASVGPGMSAALCGTFFGALLGYANMTPIAKKLEMTSEEEVLYKEVATEGILSILHGESPVLMQEKLLTFLPMKERLKFSSKQEA